MHIAIIPDGNRRWAASRGLPGFMGHRAGAKAIEAVLERALQQKISHLTLWIASINNLTKRSSEEVQFLFNLFTSYFTKIASSKEIHENQVKIEVLGCWRQFCPPECVTAIENALKTTSAYNAFHFTILLAYNGTEEMTQAIQGIINDAGESKPVITGETIKNHLYTKDLPPVDLVIRTGGDPHLSTGFMMWDTAEAQLYFTDKMLPDFTPQELDKALEAYAERERRHGG